MEKLITIRTLEELEDLGAALDGMDFIAFDTETTGVTKESEIIGFSISADVSEGYYVILSYWDVAAQTLKRLETFEGAKAFLSKLVGKNLIMHNAVFDCSMVETNFGVNLMPSVHTDTMILAHLLDENRACGLKDLGVLFFGEDARQEQIEMRQSVYANGGVLTKELYELYKADADLIARYGAKDTILTLKVFYELVPDLFEQGLDKFFYEEESMPLLRGPTYDLNTSGLRVDPDRLQKLKSTLEAECLELKAFIYKEITAHVSKKYPGKSKKTTFNIGASAQLAWLLYFELGNEFNTLTDAGREVCKALDLKLPYTAAAKREFIAIVEENKGRVYADAAWNPKTKKMGKPKKVRDPWFYTACGKESLGRLAGRYKWVEKLLEYSKNLKILNTYVIGIQERMQYNVIRPSFLQHGTTSGRYSSRNPNFQNLPKKDKRVKACIVARPGKVFVGADESQLEPRCFASVSGDETLLACFRSGEDFYSVVGAPVYGKNECSLFKDQPDSFAVKYPGLRDNSKVFALATPYGRTAAFQASAMKTSIDEARELINRYFEEYPKVEQMMLESHEQAKREGVVYSLFGRPRRIPQAKLIPKIYGKNTRHADLPYEARTLLNLGMNHRVQSTAASIMNRAAIACWRRCRELEAVDPAWKEVRIVMQIHDELILEGPEHLAEQMAEVLKYAMEKTVVLPGVDFEAIPAIAKDIAALK
jgi:DNA polymerase I-like protein with 3'-5' exonuclease and polymerase domains